MRTPRQIFHSLTRLRKILLSLLLALSVIIALLSSIVSTQAGSRWALQAIARLLAVELGDTRGNLLSGLDIASLDYTRDELALHAEKVSLRWQPLALFYTSLSVQSLKVDYLRLRLPATSPPAAEPYVWPNLAQPLRIEVEKLQLRRLEVQQGDRQLALDNIRSSFSLGAFQLRLTQLQLAAAQAQLQLSGTVALRYPYAVNAKANWQYAPAVDANLPAPPAPPVPPVPPVFAGKLQLKGDIKQLKLEHELTQPLQLSSHAEVAPGLHDPRQSPNAVVVSSWPEQSLPASLAQWLRESAVFGQLKPVTASQGQLELRGWLDHIALAASITANTADGRWELSAKAAGDPARRIQLERLALIAKPSGAETAKPSADNRQRENVIALTGEIEPRALRWQLQLKAEHVNFEDFIAGWPSDLAASGVLAGDYVAATQALHLSLSQLDARGELRQLALSAQGDIGYDGDDWRSSAFKLAIGANQLALKGQLGKALALEWTINAPQLNQIDPSISGSIVSTGLLGGTRAQPSLQASAQIKQLVWRDYALDNLNLKLAPQASALQQPAAPQRYDLLLDASHLQWQNLRLAQLNLKGGGTLAEHLLEGAVASPEFGTLSFGLASSWKDEQWRGQWRQLTLELKQMPRWYLSASAPMLLDKTRGELGKLCLTSPSMQALDSRSALQPEALPYSDASVELLKKIAGDSLLASALAQQEMPNLCINGSWSASAGSQAKLHFNAVPARIWQHWFKADVILQGVLDGQLDWRAQANKPAVLEAHLQTRGVQFTYQFQGGNTEVYPLVQGSLDLSLKNNLLSAVLLSDWGKYGVINADAKYGLGDQKLQGKLNAALYDLAPLESLLPFLNDVQGSASASMTLAGSLAKPQLQGSLQLQNGRANLPKLGLSLKDISLQMRSQSATGIQVDGQLSSGDGTLMLKGELNNLGADDWSWHSNIYGANIRIIEQPQLIATVSPNLQLAANAQAINLTGTSEIPWARAALKTLPASATQVSDDVVVIESKTRLPAHSSQTLPFYTNINLFFGDDVRFKGFGLDSQLSGKINVLKEQNRPTLTTGYVAVGKGNYKAYGQDLVIERGRLIFQGPYDNPGLDIRALRVMDTVTAGLEIGGTLQHPKSTVFSIPASSDSEAMAVLLTGKPLSQSSQADAYSIIGAIGSLGMDKGQMMTADIAHLFRLDEMTIKSDKGLEQSALWMGKYVTPKLFIRYMVGLFDQAFTLGMRYQLNERLRLEAESGKTQSLDMIYKIER